MVALALICSAVIVILLVVLNVAERAYLRAHSSGAARDLAVAGMQARESGPIEPSTVDSLLAETLAQDLFHDPAPPPKRGLFARRDSLHGTSNSPRKGPGARRSSPQHETGRAR